MHAKLFQIAASMHVRGGDLSWLDYAEWTQTRSWPEPEVNDDAEMYAKRRHEDPDAKRRSQDQRRWENVISRNLVVALSIERERASSLWRRLGKRLWKVHMHRISAARWLADTRETLKAASRRAEYQLAKSKSMSACRVRQLGRAAREEAVRMLQEEDMYARVRAARLAAITSEMERRRGVEAQIALTAQRCPQWFNGHARVRPQV